MRRSQFQYGSLRLVERAGNRKAWEYRWYETQPDGTRHLNLVLGTLEQYPNETAAQKAVVALRVDINVESLRTSLAPISVQMLIATAVRFAKAGIIPGHPLRVSGHRMHWRFLLSELRRVMLATEPKLPRHAGTEKRTLANLFAI